MREKISSACSRRNMKNQHWLGRFTSRNAKIRAPASARLGALIGAAHLDIAKSRRGRAMAGTHDLLWLSLSTVGRTPECPFIARADGIHGIPKLGGNSAIGRVLKHARALPVLDLPSHLRTELEVIALVI